MFLLLIKVARIRFMLKPNYIVLKYEFLKLPLLFLNMFLFLPSEPYLNQHEKTYKNLVYSRHALPFLAGFTSPDLALG